MLLTAWLLLVAPPPPAYCADMRTTGYVRGAHSPWTADGTDIFTSEPIAAASYDIPLGAVVAIDGLGVYRVADRGGGLGSSRWVDVAVWTAAQAYAATGVREVCVYPPGGQP